MAFRRRRFGSKRRRYGRRRPYSTSMTKVARREAKKVFASQLEKHYWDTLNGGQVDYNGVIVSLTEIAQGDTDLTRTGDRVRIASIKGGVQAYNNTTALSTNLGTVVRVIIFQWLQSDSTDFPTASSDIIQNTFVAGIDAPFAPYAKDFAGYKFVPLWDRIIRLNSGKNATFLKFQINARDFKKKAKPYIQFTSATTEGIGKIFMGIWSNNDTTGEPTVRYNARVRFTE